ncbi:MAG: hypothetical protein DMF63_17825 [Acidobacteria bacterium]|nr:MAG: hypothetical protein DMF63_17825 [Acidobacteriota bacterium]
MLRFVRFVNNLLRLNGRLAADRADQARDGYLIEWSNHGPERYISYSDNDRELDVHADFTLLNDVVLYSDSLRSWTAPQRKEVTPFEYQKVLNRVIRYLSCWGDVRIDDRKLQDSEDLKRALTELGIDFTERDDGIIVYRADADSMRKRFREEKRDS